MTLLTRIRYSMFLNFKASFLLTSTKPILFACSRIRDGRDDKISKFSSRHRLMSPPPPSSSAAGLTAALISVSTALPCPPNFLFFAAAAAFSVFCILKPAAASPSSALSFRRRLISTASVSMRRIPPSAPSIVFSSPESLSDWLRPLLPSAALASWGVTPGTKSIHNLWLEVSQGEISLLMPDDEILDENASGFTPLRAVNVATLNIRNSRGAVLVESRQLLSDGTVRYRSRPLSEKMKPGETVEEAVIRAVREELGIEGVKIVPGSYHMRVEERESVSYPGLKARYVLHSVDAEVEGLPEDEEFSTEENGEKAEAMEKAVFVKRHFWKWVEDGDSSVQKS